MHACVCGGEGYLCKEDAVKELVGFLLILGDVSIGMHAKDLRVWDNGERADILQVVLML